MKSRLGAGLAAAILAAACQATPIYNQYYYQNTLEMNRLAFAVGLAAVEPSPNPIGGRMKVVIPSERYLSENLSADEKTQFDRMDAPARSTTVTARASHATVLFSYYPDILKKAGLFTDLAVVRDDLTKEPDLGGFDYVHWFAPNRPEGEKYWVKGKDGMARIVPVAFQGRFQNDGELAKAVATQYRAAMESFVRTTYAGGK